MRRSIWICSFMARRHSSRDRLAASDWRLLTGWPRKGQWSLSMDVVRIASKKAVEEIRRAVPDASITGTAADLATDKGAELLIRECSSVEILVNNVGIYDAKPFFDISDAEWLRFFETNVMGGVRLSRAYLPGMLQRNWGRIVFISSESAINIPVEMIHYGMTKTAQLAVSRGLAEMTAGTGVTVNSVLPGPTRSEGVEGFVSGMAQSQGKTTAEVEQAFFERIRPSSLLRRFAEPEEVAAMVAFVCSPLASATNGAALTCGRRGRPFGNMIHWPNQMGRATTLYSPPCPLMPSIPRKSRFPIRSFGVRP